jgi:hypothetical protein
MGKYLARGPRNESNGVGACLKSASISITHTMSNYISMDLSGMGTSPGSQDQRTLRVYSQEVQRHPFRSEDLPIEAVLRDQVYVCGGVLSARPK